MLTRLYIRNYALIKTLEINFISGLNVITGETGAGKSILLGALGMLLGNRADTKALYDGEEKCIVEGEFDLSSYSLKNVFEEENLDFEATCIIRREITTNGKSRAFINDTPVNLDSLKNISSKLVDIHSQHDTQLLGSAPYQLDIIDTLIGNLPLKDSFNEVFRRYKKAERAHENLIEENLSSKKEYDFDKFIFDELEKAKLTDEEQESLEHELNISENTEEVKTKLSEAAYQLSHSDQSILSSLYNTSHTMNTLSKYSDKYKELTQRIESCIIELKDIVSEIEEEEENTTYNPDQIETIRERLSLIYTLQKKHQVGDVRGLLEIYSKLKLKLDRVTNLEEEIKEAEELKNLLLEETLKIARKLLESRLAGVPQIEKGLMSLLQNLGMPNASIKIKNSEVPLGPSGINEMSILFSSNKGLAPQELRNVASGGEFSRLMLGLKYMLANKIALPTIIFDEIDTGVSGEISIKMGKMMKEMANIHQVIAITHLPQIASQGDAQYFVYKEDSSDRTISNIKQLGEEERVIEIAKMIGGERPSSIAISNAKELLGVN